MSKKAVLPLEEQVEREAELVKKRCPTLAALPADVRKAVLGDYLVHRNPDKKVTKVALSYKACLRLQEVGFTDARLLPVFEEHPDLSRMEMRALLLERLRRIDARKRVFFTLWQVIGEFLHPRDLRNWREACGFASVEEVGKYLGDRDVKRSVCKMLREMPSLNPDFDYEHSPIFSRLWQYVRDYPDHTGHTTHVLVPAIAAFMRETQPLTPENRAARTARLRNSLKSMGATLRSDSSFAEAYISGSQYCTVEEVTATLYITNCLFSASHIAWSEYHYEFEEELVMSVLKYNNPWIDAATRICNSKRFHSACYKGEVEEERAERRREAYEARRQERYWEGRFD